MRSDKIPAQAPYSLQCGNLKIDPADKGEVAWLGVGMIHKEGNIRY